MAPSAILAARRSEVVSSAEVSSPPITRSRQDALLRKSLLNLRQHKSPSGDDVSGGTSLSMARSPLGMSFTSSEAAVSPLLGCMDPLQHHDCRGDTTSSSASASMLAKGLSATPSTSPDSSVFDFSAITGLSCSKKFLTNTPELHPSLDLVSIGEGRDQEASLEPLSLPHGDMVYHRDVVEVEFGGEAFSSRLVAKVPFNAGSVIANIEGVTFGVSKRYTSVQCGESRHLELNSDLVFINHSCNPNVAMDVDAMQIRALREIAAGDELSFFYPSTEWDMDQPFQCWCKAEQCVGLVAGAKHLSAEVLEGYWISKHIAALVAARDTAPAGSNRKASLVVVEE